MEFAALIWYPVTEAKGSGWISRPDRADDCHQHTYCKINLNFRRIHHSTDWTDTSANESLSWEIVSGASIWISRILVRVTAIRYRFVVPNIDSPSGHGLTYRIPEFAQMDMCGTNRWSRVDTIYSRLLYPLLVPSTPIPPRVRGSEKARCFPSIVLHAVSWNY